MTVPSSQARSPHCIACTGQTIGVNGSCALRAWLTFRGIGRFDQAIERRCRDAVHDEQMKGVFRGGVLRHLAPAGAGWRALVLPDIRLGNPAQTPGE